MQVYRWKLDRVKFFCAGEKTDWRLIRSKIGGDGTEKESNQCCKRTKENLEKRHRKANSSREMTFSPQPSIFPMKRRVNSLSSLVLCD
jgi:hypothetical protein